MRRLIRSEVWSRPSTVAALYLLAALVMTWPLVAVMTRRIAGDTGDSLFNCWVLLWTSGQLLHALQGDLSALAQYWNGNIFYPAPLTLAYSNHLTPQMLQALPVLAATGNVVLAYNLLFIGTIVLSGLGVYLLVRELTGQAAAAFLAGLAFAFAPYRIDQYEHLEVLSSQWMPFALYGFRRFFVTMRLRPLVGGAAALVAQALSSGYYLAYFTPFAVAYCVFELVARGRLGDLRAWRALVVAGGIVLFAVGLFSWPYVQVRRLGDVGKRDRLEIEQFSADTHAFATVSQRSRLLGSHIDALSRNEGRGFPGVAILAFALLGIGYSLTRTVEQARRADDRKPHPRRFVAALAAMLVVVLCLLGSLLAHVLVTGRGIYAIAGMVVRHRPATLLMEIAGVAALLAVVSPWWRHVMRGVRGSTVAFFGWAALAAAWLSLGPMMYANKRSIGLGLYYLFYRWVPGFDGLRVPSLNLMLVAFFLAVIAGFGATALIERRGSAGRVVVVVGMIAILAESWSVSTTADVPRPGPVYDVVRALPAGTVVAEFPFGDAGSEIRYTFFAGHHRKPIVNGYSGFFPASYVTRVAWLAPVHLEPKAWRVLLSSGATHAIVHEGVQAGEGGSTASDWLRQHGARDIGVFENDRLFHLR
jgi:hypothetical protein